MELEKIKEGTYKLSKYQELRKGKNNEYRIIYPYKIDGKLCWRNLLKVDMTILFLLLALSLIIYNGHINTQECIEIISDPYTFCVDRGFLPMEGESDWGWNLNAGDKEYTGDSP